MNYITLSASKPGVPAPKLEKRTSDTRTYRIDCGPLLAPGEMISGNITHKSNPELVITEARTRQGRYLQFKVSGGPQTMPFVEYPVRFNVDTTADNNISVPVSIKVYSD